MLKKVSNLVANSKLNEIGLQLMNMNTTPKGTQPTPAQPKSLSPTSTAVVIQVVTSANANGQHQLPQSVKPLKVSNLKRKAPLQVIPTSAATISPPALKTTIPEVAKKVIKLRRKSPAGSRKKQAVKSTETETLVSTGVELKDIPTPTLCPESILTLRKVKVESPSQFIDKIPIPVKVETNDTQHQSFRSQSSCYETSEREESPPKVIPIEYRYTIKDDLGLEDSKAQSISIFETPTEINYTVKVEEEPCHNK
jgi:hypothetical protein